MGGMGNSAATGRFTTAAAGQGPPRGVSRAEGWWIVALAVMLFVTHSLLFQALAFEWGGIIRFGVLFFMIAGVSWLAMRQRSVERVHPRHHGRTLLIAYTWGIVFSMAAEWFWVAQGDGAAVPWLVSTAVAAVAFAPLAWVGWRLTRLG